MDKKKLYLISIFWKYLKIKSKLGPTTLFLAGNGDYLNLVQRFIFYATQQSEILHLVYKPKAKFTEAQGKALQHIASFGDQKIMSSAENR